MSGVYLTLLHGNDGQPVDAFEIRVTADQCGTKGECSRGYPEVVLIQGEAALLARQLNSRVEVARLFGYWLAAKDSQELAASLFQLRAPPALGQSGDTEQYFASDDRTGDHPITAVQAGHPLFDLGAARIMSLMAFVSRRYVTAVVTCRTRLGHALAALTQRSPLRDHPPGS
jgi:hypothetical protein